LHPPPPWPLATPVPYDRDTLAGIEDGRVATVGGGVGDEGEGGDRKRESTSEGLPAAATPLSSLRVEPQDLDHYNQHKCHKRESKQERATHLSLALVPCEIH
jgi:hypothetical protein